MFNGERVKQLIKAKNITQVAFAESIDMSPSTFSQMIGPIGNPTSRNAQKIADALGVQMSELYVSVITYNEPPIMGSVLSESLPDKKHKPTESETIQLLKKIIDAKDALIAEKENLVKEKERTIRILLKEKGL